MANVPRVPSLAEVLASVPGSPEPSHIRGGPLAVASSKATEGELKHALIALKNPPQKGDITGLLSTLAGAGAAIAKVAKDCASGGSFDLLSVVVVVVAALAVFASARKCLEVWLKKHPFHDQVIKDIEAVLAEAGPQSRNAGTPPPVGTSR